jgi:hypothetical protein
MPQPLRACHADHCMHAARWRRANGEAPSSAAAVYPETMIP